MRRLLVGLLTLASTLSHADTLRCEYSQNDAYETSGGLTKIHNLYCYDNDFDRYFLDVEGKGINFEAMGSGNLQINCPSIKSFKDTDTLIGGEISFGLLFGGKIGYTRNKDKKSCIVYGGSVFHYLGTAGKVTYKIRKH